ncbi:MAG: hypothetical protein AAF733_13055 [Verrucomicrobiota bacterium]
MDGLVQPVTLEERLQHIAKAKAQLGTTIPWLADSMTNELKNALGDRNNSEIVVTPEGIIAVARDWSDPVALRADLERLVGKADTFTQASEIDSPVAAKVETKKIPTGIVSRIPRPSGSMPLVVTTTGEGPFYLKLRAEASKTTLDERKGNVHLSFQLDPIHEVHWNNLAPPLKFSIIAPEGASTVPATVEAAKVTEAESDLDPRDFLVEMDGSAQESEDPFRIRVDYFACDDAGRWCKPVTQEFDLVLRYDRDAGKVFGNGGRNSSKGNARPGGGRRMPDPAQILSRLDTDESGSISREEAAGPMIERFDQMDTDRDGAISAEELKSAFANRMRGAK